MELLTPETLNTIYIVLGIAVAWVVLRFVLKLAKKIFAIGCFGIIVLGAVLYFMQFANGG